MLKLAYGDGWIEYDFSAFARVQVIEGIPSPVAVRDSLCLVQDALARPVGSVPLAVRAARQKARNALVVVNDVTRPTPYQFILPPLVQELNQAGIPDEEITLLVATGIHRPHTEVDNLYCYGEEMCRRLKIVSHDCERGTVPIGMLSNGLPLGINRLAIDSDLLISTGLVNLHYIAGYSGGRKSILPGIASREAIEASHKMMSDPRACLASLNNNPVNLLMLEAAGMARASFAINVVGSHHRVDFAAAGDILESWLEAVSFCERGSVVCVDERSDVVVASCGGYPKDINVYQAQKALDTAAMAVKPGGTIILLAECREGLGEEVFSDWIKAASCPDDIVRRFHNSFELGGHKAYAICRILEKADIIMVSALPPGEVEDLFILPMPGLRQALEWAEQKHGQDMSISIMPEAPRTAVSITGETS